MAPKPRTPTKSRGRQSKKQGGDSDNEKQQASASSARAGRKSARKAQAAPNTPTPKGKKQVKKNEVYVDDEAQGDDERSSGEDDEEDDEDRAFIDDRDERRAMRFSTVLELEKSASSDDEEVEPAPVPETPKARTRGSNNKKRVDSDEEPAQPVRSKGKKRAKSDEEEEVKDRHVLLIWHAFVWGSLMILESNRKGNVSVKFLENKIAVTIPEGTEDRIVSSALQRIDLSRHVTFMSPMRGNIRGTTLCPTIPVPSCPINEKKGLLIHEHSSLYKNQVPRYRKYSNSAALQLPDDQAAGSIPAKAIIRVSSEIPKNRTCRLSACSRQVKATPSAVERAKDEAQLMSDGDDNPFLAKEDDEFPGAADVEDQPSPRKKAKTNTVVDDDDAMDEAETSRDPIQETPKDSNIDARGAGPSDAGPSGIRYLRADSPESTGAALVDAISNFDDPVHRRYMCRTMYDTYTGPKAPPLIGVLFSEAKGLLTCYTNDSTNVLIMFRKAMKYVGIMQDDPRFDFLKKLSVTAVFGRYLFNLARVDSADFVKNVVRSGNYQNTVYRCLRNLSRSPDYNDKDYVGFTLYGTIIESQLTKSFIVKTRDGRNYHLRHAIIRPLSMEIQRTMNGIATMLGAEAIGMPIRTGGIQLSTTLSPNPYPDAPKVARDSSEEPDLSLPAYSVGGRTVHRETDEADRRAEIKNAVATGIRFTNDHLPVYDLRAAVRKGNYPGCNQETLGAAEPWREGEIPENSYVCAHYVPGSRPHKDTKHEDVSFQLMRIVVLATPDRD
ncbi:hypothetical protein BC629DRAFT_1434121 [Irpex lacteus]|nr:hypothetical protein BC629DRAFT_1434121 [Irpex lacteus]